MRKGDTGVATIVPVRVYEGVKGWLLFLCILLVVLIPIKSVVFIAYYFAKLSTLFRQYPSIVIPIIVYSALAVLMIGFSVYAGMALWTVRGNAVRVAKKFLIVFAAFSIVDVAFVIFVPTFAGMPFTRAASLIPKALKEAFQQIIVLALCYAYLSSSKRVRATYQKTGREETMSHVAS
jgi:hypothetical protein